MTKKTAPKKTPPRKKGGVAFQSLVSLPAEKLAAIDTHLLSEGSVMELVRLIQGKWGLLTETAPDTLRRYLHRYKLELIEPKQIAIAAKFSHTENVRRVADQVELLTARFEPLQELEKLIHTQNARVAKMAILEDKSPTLFDSQTKNIAVLHTMLKDLAGLHMDVGMIRKVPMQVAHVLTPDQHAQMTRIKAFEQERSATIDALQFLQDEGVLGSDASVIDLNVEEN